MFLDNWEGHLTVSMRRFQLLTFNSNWQTVKTDRIGKADSNCMKLRTFSNESHRDFTF